MRLKKHVFRDHQQGGNTVLSAPSEILVIFLGAFKKHACLSFFSWQK
jgi:hypothetical protein